MAITLRSLLNTEDFTYRLSSLEGRMKRDFFRFWQVHAPHYTDHGETHCKTILMNLDELIPDDVKNDLNEYEIFLLLSSVWLHDIGIMCATKTKEEDERIRSNHHERSRQFVLDHLKDLFNTQERNIIGELCFAHRDIVPIQEVTSKKIVRHEVLGNKVIRIRFLSGLLRLADSCDLCHTRTSEDLLDTSKLSEEASFHHILHERVSGILFEQKEKRICLSINIGSDEEKSICQQYLSTKLQLTLNSVKDVLIRNGIYYIDVYPEFHKVSAETKLVPPKAVEEMTLKLKDISKKFRAQKKARELYLKKDFEESLKHYDKILKDEPDNAFIYFQKAEALSRIGKLDEAGEFFETSIKLDPENYLYITNAGHFFGEFCLDIETSFTYLEKAFKLQPNNAIAALNYAEGLVTMDRFEEAYNLATKNWKISNNLMLIFNAQFIRICSLIFRHKEVEGLSELRQLVDFLKMMPPSFRKMNTWTYNKIRHYIKNSTLDDATKKVLIAALDLIEYKMTLDDFEQNFGANLPK